MKDYNLDRLKIYELLMYHDVVEIEAGDTPLSDNVDIAQKQEMEKAAAERLMQNFPQPLDEKFIRLFNEFEERKTPEAKFAKAIDALDADIQELSAKEDWKGWTKEFLIEKRLKHFKEFPELEKTFYKLLEYLVENKYLEK